jgi:hypothetical protein
MKFRFLRLHSSESKRAIKGQELPKNDIEAAVGNVADRERDSS